MARCPPTQPLTMRAALPVTPGVGQPREQDQHHPCLMCVRKEKTLKGPLPPHPWEHPRHRGIPQFKWPNRGHCRGGRAERGAVGEVQRHGGSWEGVPVASHSSVAPACGLSLSTSLWGSPAPQALSHCLPLTHLCPILPHPLPLRPQGRAWQLRSLGGLGWGRQVTADAPAGPLENAQTWTVI